MNSSWTVPSRLSNVFSEHVTPFEAALVQWFSELRRHPWLTALFMAASRLGDGPLWYATGILCLVFGDGRARWAAAAAGVSVGLSAMVFVLIKRRVCRPRPFEIWSDLPCLMAPPDEFSFPSGHTMTAFSVYAAFRVLLPESQLFLLPVAVLVGLSRVFLGVHYPSDVLVGSLLGTLIGGGIGYAGSLLLP